MYLSCFYLVFPESYFLILFNIYEKGGLEGLEERDGRVIRVPFADMSVKIKMIKVIKIVNEEMLIVKGERVSGDR